MVSSNASEFRGYRARRAVPALCVSFPYSLLMGVMGKCLSHEWL